MRIGELSQRSGVAIPTIKYYLREGLLEAGASRAANQADYGDDHLRRLRLVRALIDVGGVSVASARAVIEALGRTDLDPHDLLGVAHDAVTPTRRPDRDSPSWMAARAEAAELVERRGWIVNPVAIGLDQAADAISALRSLDAVEIADEIDAYATAAHDLARVEVERVISRQDPTGRLELLALGTVLGEALFNALRLLAHEHESAVQLGIARQYPPQDQHNFTEVVL
jgi:DNA-binding transcriptional MerR regulator